MSICSLCNVIAAPMTEPCPQCGEIRVYTGDIVGVTADQYKVQPMPPPHADLLARLEVRARMGSYSAGQVIREAIAALTVGQDRTSFAWVIERTDTNIPTYWDGRGGKTFSYKHEDAVRFCRQEDAERIRHWMLRPEDRDVTRSVEHGWMLPTSPPEGGHNR